MPKKIRQPGAERNRQVLLAKQAANAAKRRQLEARAKQHGRTPQAQRLHEFAEACRI